MVEAIGPGRGSGVAGQFSASSAITMTCFLSNDPPQQGRPITYGRTLLGVRVDINEDAVINRIVPVGKTIRGDPLLIRYGLRRFPRPTK